MSATADMDGLYTQLEAQLAVAAKWPVRVEHPGLTVSTGRLPDIPIRAYHSVTQLEAPLERVVEVLADRTFEYLPQWNREFVEGTVETTSRRDETGADWELSVFYETPAPLSNREYLYYFGRRTQPDGRVLIGYRSLPTERPARAGYVRATLYPTVHRCSAQPDGTTRLEHVLATDLGGAFAPWVQNHLLTRSLIQAHVRDGLALQSLLSQS
ncbi:MAG: hypothetical protein ACI9WU_002707 [Myxococcota bacterium]|jgi:hypothetical protein